MGMTKLAAADLLERDEQLQHLRDVFSRVVEGRGSIVALAAEAGAGKTSLTERFTAGLGRAARVYWSACENLSTPEILLPLRDIVRATGKTFDFGADHIRTFEAVLQLLSQNGEPAVLVMEDIHWADSATLDLIRFLARRIRRIRALLIVTYRDEELDARSPVRYLLGEAPPGSVHRLTLAPLTLAGVSSLAAATGRSGEELFALTAGNPFLVTEALAVESDDPTDAVRDFTQARAARMSETACRVLEAVSIFPRHAETPLIADLAEGSIDAGLDECIDRGMLALDGGLLRFRHELARRAIEHSIPATRRRTLHQKAVDLLMRRSDARAGEIAHHAERAGDVKALLKFAQRAGHEAARATAHRESAAHFSTVLRHRNELDHGALVSILEVHAEQSYLMGSSGAAMTSMAEAAEIRRRAHDDIGLGRDLMRLTRFAWMCGHRAEAEIFIDESIAVLQRLPESAELAWAYSHRSQLEMLDCRMHSALRWGEMAAALAARLGETEIRVHALGNIGSAKAHFEIAGPSAELEESLDLAIAGGHHDHVERAFCNLTCIYVWRGDHQLARAVIARGADYAAARELTHWEGYLRGWRAIVYLQQGNWSAAEEEASQTCSRIYSGEVYWFPALIALATVRVRRGEQDADTPLATARRLATGLNELQRTIYVAVLDAERAWLGSHVNDRVATPSGTDLQQSIATLRNLRSVAGDRSARWVAEEAALWLYMLGERVSQTADFSESFRDHCEGRWQLAAAAWRRRGRPFEEALALYGGDPAAQRQALEIFDRLGAAPAAARLRRMMRARGIVSIPRGPIAGTRANPSGLTQRQVQVLRLMDDQLSNPEIASRLCISVKTAEHHVSAIMARLDAPTRANAVVEARKRGLLPLQ
jgi:DNA-binding CsgD family transcriptional regulator